jgi:hypothetical protein
LSRGSRRPDGVEDTFDVCSARIVTFGRSRVGRHRPHPSEPGSRSLPIVVRHECIDRPKIDSGRIDSGRHVYRVQGANLRGSVR